MTLQEEFNEAIDSRDRMRAFSILNSVLTKIARMKKDMCQGETLRRRYATPDGRSVIAIEFRGLMEQKIAESLNIATDMVQKLANL